MARSRTSGFALVEAVMAIIVIAIIGAGGQKAYTHFIAPKFAQQAVPMSTIGQTTITVPATITTTNDLDSANKALEQLPLDDADDTQLDSATSLF